MRHCALDTFGDGTLGPDDTLPSHAQVILARFDLEYSNGPMPHEQMMRSIERIGTEVMPRVHDLLASDGSIWRCT